MARLPKPLPRPFKRFPRSTQTQPKPKLQGLPARRSAAAVSGLCSAFLRASRCLGRLQILRCLYASLFRSSLCVFCKPRLRARRGARSDAERCWGRAKPNSLLSLSSQTSCRCAPSSKTASDLVVMRGGGEHLWPMRCS